MVYSQCPLSPTALQDPATTPAAVLAGLNSNLSPLFTRVSNKVSLACLTRRMQFSLLVLVLWLRQDRAHHLIQVLSPRTWGCIPEASVFPPDWAWSTDESESWSSDPDGSPLEAWAGQFWFSGLWAHSWGGLEFRIYLLEKNHWFRNGKCSWEMLTEPSQSWTLVPGAFVVFVQLPSCIQLFATPWTGI